MVMQWAESPDMADECSLSRATPCQQQPKHATEISSFCYTEVRLDLAGVHCGQLPLAGAGCWVQGIDLAVRKHQHRLTAGSLDWRGTDSASGEVTLDNAR